MRRIIEEVPQIEEAIVRDSAVNAIIQIVQTRDVAAELDCVAAHHFRGNVFEAVRPLIENATYIRTKMLKRDATGFSNPIDFAAAGIRKISAVTFFKPTGSSSGQFLVFDNTQDLFVVTDFNGAGISQPYSIRDTLRVLNPTAVTTITTGADAGAFAICNGENSEVVVFRLD